jgi:hypothetical protein
MVSTPSTTIKTHCRGVYDRLTAGLSIWNTQTKSTGCLEEGLDPVVKWWGTRGKRISGPDSINVSMVGTHGEPGLNSSTTCGSRGGHSYHRGGWVGPTDSGED